MIILITGATHTGKTLLAKKLIEKYRYICISIDHIKMGLIRSGNTDIGVENDEALTNYLWPIVREIIKTAIENGQDLIIEGCYIPFDWRKDFGEEYLRHIKFYCLVMSRKYIEKNFEKINGFESVIENRLHSLELTKEELIEENESNLEACRKKMLDFVLIDEDYNSAFEKQMFLG
ncbi:MAG: adenylate kinase [Acutalibacteraceae bacterium]